MHRMLQSAVGVVGRARLQRNAAHGSPKPRRAGGRLSRLAALAAALLAAGAGHASTVQAQAAAVGGQATCGVFGPPTSIGNLFGSIFLVGNVGNGISDCGLQGSIANQTLPTGTATISNSVAATVGGGPYIGTSSATASYGTLSSSAHGLMDGVTNTFGFSESGGFSRFNDQLVISSPTVANGSAGSVAYTFKVTANLTTPRGTALTYASQNLAQLAVAQNAIVQGNVFGASTYPFSLGSVLGASDSTLRPGFVYGQGSVVGSYDFSTIRLPFTWGATTDLTVGLAAVTFAATGGELDAQMRATLTRIDVFGANGAPIGDFKIDAASGSVYTADGVSPVPEPPPAALLLAGLAVFALMSHRLRRQVG